MLPPAACVSSPWTDRSAWPRPGGSPRALDLARTAIDEAGFAERVAVIAFDERADVIALPGGAADARAAVNGLAVGHGATRYAAVIEKATELASGGPARLVIITDLQRAGWDGEIRAKAPAALTLDVRNAGTPMVNVAVVDLRPGTSGVVVEVRNASATARQGSVTLTHNGGAVGRAPFSAPAQSSVDVTIPWRIAASGSISAAVEDPDGFPSDNTRHLILKRSGAPAVLVVQSGAASGFFLLRALEAAGGTIEARPVTGLEIGGGRAAAIVEPGCGHSAVDAQSRSGGSRRDRVVRARRRRTLHCGGARGGTRRDRCDVRLGRGCVHGGSGAHGSSRWPRPTCATRSSDRSALWPRTLARSISIRPGGCGRTGGRSRRNSATALRPCSIAPKERDGSCCSRRTSIGSGMIFRSTRRSCRSRSRPSDTCRRGAVRRSELRRVRRPAWPESRARRSEACGRASCRRQRGSARVEHGSHDRRRVRSLDRPPGAVSPFTPGRRKGGTDRGAAEPLAIWLDADAGHAGGRVIRREAVGWRN